MSDLTTEQESAEQTAVDEAQQVHTFLNSPAGVNTIQRTREKIRREWEDALTVEARESAHQRFAALRSLCEEWRSTFDNGEVVKQARKVRERQAKQTKA